MNAIDVILISVLGMAIVFAVLILLMGMIKLVSFFTKSNGKKPAEAAPAVAPAPVAAPASAPTAVGSCGEVKLFDVPDKTAAMVMAIVAEQIGEPLNTLRFISIKEVK